MNGFHTANLRWSLTCSKSSIAGAAIVALRSTRNSAGRRATTMSRMAMSATTPNRMLMIIAVVVLVFSLMFKSAPAFRPHNHTNENPANPETSTSRFLSLSPPPAESLFRAPLPLGLRIARVQLFERTHCRRASRLNADLFEYFLHVLFHR